MEKITLMWVWAGHDMGERMPIGELTLEEGTKVMLRMAQPITLDEFGRLSFALAAKTMIDDKLKDGQVLSMHVGSPEPISPSPLVAAYHSTADLLADLDNLRHMLGVGPTYRRKHWGWRNYFQSSEGHNDHDSLLRLKAAGLVEEVKAYYFRATRAGCEAVGLDHKQTLRALRGGD